MRKKDSQVRLLSPINLHIADKATSGRDCLLTRFTSQQVWLVEYKTVRYSLIL